MTTTTRTIKTICSGCSLPVTLDLAAGEARVRFPGNGIRGRNHVPGGVGVADLTLDDNDLIMWDCPVCDEADSYEAD